MTSALRVVNSRWVIISIVMLPWSSSIAPWMRLSFSESRLLVASSRINKDGLRSKARARAKRCLSPPDRRTPRSPRTVSMPSGSLETKSSAAANRSASRISPSLAPGRAHSRFSRTVSWNRNVSCGT